MDLYGILPIPQSLPIVPNGLHFRNFCALQKLIPFRKIRNAHQSGKRLIFFKVTVIQTSSFALRWAHHIWWTASMDCITASLFTLQKRSEFIFNSLEFHAAVLQTKILPLMATFH